MAALNRATRGGQMADWQRTDVDAKDGEFSMGGSLYKSGQDNSLKKVFDTSSYGYTEFRFSLKFYSSTPSFPALGGIDLFINGSRAKKIVSWTNGTDISLNEWVEFFVFVPPSATNEIDFRLIQSASFPDARGSLMSEAAQKVFLDDYGFRDVPLPIDPEDVQSKASTDGASVGINDIPVVPDSVQSLTHVSSPDINVPATTDSAESDSNASGIELSLDSPVDPYSLESASEISVFILSGHAPLLLDSAQSAVQLRKFGMDISPPDVETAAQNESFKLSVRHSTNIDSAESTTNASSIIVSGSSLADMDSAESLSQAESITASARRNLFVDSAQSSSQILGFGVAQTVLFDPGDISVCTPAGNDESIFATTAGEDITKGDLVTVFSDDTAYRSIATDQALSIYTGFAITSASEGETVIVVEAGDVKVGQDKLSPNQLYIVSLKSGRIRHASEIGAGEYLSVVGIAISSSVLRIGSNFASLLLTAESDSPATNDSVDVDPDAVKMDDSANTPSVISGQVSEAVDIGDVLTRKLARADSSSEALSSFGGIAISDALAECTVAVCTAGDVFLGQDSLEKNMVYAVSREPGNLMLAQDWQLGDYATLIGMAIDSSTIRLGEIEKGTLVG